MESTTDTAPPARRPHADTLRGALDVLGTTATLAGATEPPCAALLRKRARDFGLAFFALADALPGAAPPVGPTAPPSLDLMRTEAFLVASKCQRVAAALGPDGTPLADPRHGDVAATLHAIAELITALDRRLAAFRIPLRATAYLRARDDLLLLLEPLLRAAPRPRHPHPAPTTTLLPPGVPLR